MTIVFVCMGGSDTFLTARLGFVGDFGVAGGVLFRYIEVVKAWSWKAKYGGCKHEYIWNFEYGDEKIKWSLGCEGRGAGGPVCSAQAAL